ncbi:MAG: hypothetical protein AAFR11_11420 [Pseudomonadota bacterium]
MSRNEHFANYLTAIAIALTVAGLIGDAEPSGRFALIVAGVAVALLANDLLEG